MKRILPEFEFSAEQLNKVASLAAECGLCTETVKILYARGICDAKSINDFLHPSAARFISPFKMGGMREAVDLITRARDEGWCVVVYGDYDADGICAVTIMNGALRQFGIEPVLCIPERQNGYGLSTSLIDSLFDEYFPQLIITVDCGISCAAEVEYIKELGAEVIVTDHHELPDKIPDCICINPKFNDGYIYDNLCGAGVALKVAYALLGDKARKFLDFAAIATVADSVALTGENRDIVYEGLKIINSNPKSNYKQFFKDGAVTSQTLAFTIAPKINAAGRMGDARAALDLFTSADEGEISELSARLTAYNSERQKYCDELYLSAKAKLAETGVDGNIIVLSDEGWNAGFVGIVAARLADEYSRPVILFVRHGGKLRGSARSVENVNIFEALKACGEYIDEFGGHSQAAGVNVTEENFPKLKNALLQYMSLHYTAEDFVPTVYISGELTEEYSPEFARELELLEPYGVGNKRPVFLLKEGATPVKYQKLSPHLTIKSNKIELMYFGGAKFFRLAESSAEKCYLFEYNVSTFRGKEYVKGFVRDLVYSGDAAKSAAEDIALNGIMNLAYGTGGYTILPITSEEADNIMGSCPEFGTLFIAEDYQTLKAFKNSHRLNAELFLPSSKSCPSAVLISPQADADLSGYCRIICLNKIQCGNNSLAKKRVEVCTDGHIPGYISQISADRLSLLSVFANLSANVNNIRGSSPDEVAKLNSLGCNKPTAAFALAVFEELKLISFEGGVLTVYRGVKTDLANSALYNKVCKLRESVK